MSEVRDAFETACDMMRKVKRDHIERGGIVGYGIIELRDGDGKLKSVTPFANLITNYGDDYYAKKAITAIPPVSASAPTAANGMKLGTGSTAMNKATPTGMALTTYLSASNAPFDATYPQTAGLGNNLGTNAVYKTTWAAGTPSGTNTITEAVICNDYASNATSTDVNSYARVTGFSQTKTAADSLAITWNHKFLGA